MVVFELFPLCREAEDLFLIRVVRGEVVEKVRQADRHDLRR